MRNYLTGFLHYVDGLCGGCEAIAQEGIGLKRASFIWFMHYIMTSKRGLMTQRRCTIWGCRSKQALTSMLQRRCTIWGCRSKESVCSSGVHQ